MLEIVSVSFIILVVIFYLLTKDIFHPSVIVSGLWATLLSLYIFTKHPLWDLSDNFSLAISLWVFPFTIMSYICSRVPIRILHSSRMYNVNVIFFNRLFPFVIVYNLLFLFLIIFYAGGLNFYSIRQLLLQPSYPFLLDVLFYLNTFFSAYVLYGLINIENFAKKKIVLLLLLLLVVSLFKSNKTSFLSFFVSVLFILKLKNKLKVLPVIFIIISLMTLLTLVSLNRADYDFKSDGGLLNFLYIYILSPLTAFDLLLNGEYVLDGGTPGSGTLTFFYKVLNVFGADLKISELGGWVYVPLQTNVFTTMRGFYLDGGYMGIAIMGTILGTIWGFLYALQAIGHKVYVLFYALMISSLFFQSFGDYFFYTFSVTLQYYISSIIMSRGVVLYKSRK